VKKELDGTDEIEPPISSSIIVVADFAEHVWALQNNISRVFRDGRSLEHLICQLCSGEVDPMR